MSKWKRRCRGAISIFLIIVFIANFALIGVLVDAGRYRMAKASAEMALDSATGSVLSYYNQMVYDLYGLFATDSMDETKINELLTDYVSRTLQTTGVEPNVTTQLTQVIQSVISQEFEDLPEFYGYDMQSEVQLVKEDSYTLANTKMVEDQIIEHMKYRAPAALVDEAGGFFDKLKGIGAIIDRVKVSVDKSKSNADETKKDLATRADALLKRLSTYNRELQSYTVEPYMVNPAPFGSVKLEGEEKKLLEYVEAFDDAVAETMAMDEYEVKDGATAEEIAEVEAALEAALMAHARVLSRTIFMTQSRAESLHLEAEEIRKAVDALTGDYDTYIAKLQEKIDTDPNNQNVQTVYAPEIQLAQSTCGELVKNLDLVIMAMEYLKILYQNEYDAPFIETAAQTVISGCLRTVGNNTEIYEKMMDLLNSGKEPFGAGAKAYYAEAQRQLHALNVFARDFEPDKPVTINVDTDDGEDPPTTEEDKEDFRSLAKVAKDNPSDLVVLFQQTPTGSEDDPHNLPELGEKPDNGAITALLEAGLNLLEKLVDVLESARDSLYINEYAIAYFPNYVQHYKATDSSLAKDAKNKYLMDKEDIYYNFNASQAELEYILTGKGNAKDAVATRLLALRTVLNLAAIFTDTAKITQANALAATISGPFAPLVSFALLVAWGIAESVLDVSRLQNGEKVELFKQGANWKFSVGGALENLADEAIEKAGDELEDLATGAVNDISSTVEQFANQAIYEAYKEVKDTTVTNLNAAAEAGQKKVNEFSANLTKDLPEPVRQAANQATQAGSQKVSQHLQDLTNTGMDYADQAILRANEAITGSIQDVAKTINDNISKFTDEVVGKLKDAASDAIEKYFPQGTVTNTGTNDGGIFEVTMTYMDYMRIFLMLTGNTKKVQRIQVLIQTNIRYQQRNAAGEGGVEDSKLFTMEKSYGSVAAVMTGSMDFMMLGSSVLPESIKRDGRMAFAVYSHRGY